ncbi:Na+/H+ antiporter subunit B [Thermanaerothrix sp. 4228-RoL]|jgi:multicomponent Na+:H+ antiporter subunit B|uniref:Na+/H+ antiporter subunit B n=1 Tax=Thermanaerothrix solaris TaxID=3058434 RepID=A0ABU3NP62_9CHLR|nr:Na+/H+ antiporter subunit B [Thermanaerothrix sp. 4228-RoL]MDT8897782.1 Na+/H+ antiporter subunit B [Thermanaerothrix sp. 4228-RoL]
MKGRSEILSVATRYLMPLLIVFSVFLLLRGHNEIGGGFVGGLVAAVAIVLYMIAEGVAAARELLRVEPRVLIAAGLLVALSSAMVAWLVGQPFMTGLWWKQALPVVGKVGTPLIFDIGVYLTVMGTTLLILFTLAED